MHTGTVHNAATLVITDMNSDWLQIGFTNDSGETLTEGREVVVKATGTVDKKSDGTKPTLGVVVVGGKNGEKVTVRVLALLLINGKAKGGTIATGKFVVPNGTVDANGVPGYVEAVSDDVSCAYVIKGGVVDSEIKIAIMPSNIVIP